MKFENDSSKIQIIASSMEKFNVIKTEKFVFLDSMQHMSSSLEKLVDTLKNKGSENFKVLKSEFPNENKFKLMLGKGVYPYSYMTSFSKFDECIPDIDAFHDKLKDEPLQQKEYNRLKEICSMFNITTSGELHVLYVKQDVLLLTDVVEEYRNMGLNVYGLDPLHYSTLPSFTWDDMLKMTKARPQLLKDQDQYMFFERGIRGGISTVSHRYAKANNIYMTNYNNTEAPISILYTDVINLYGYAMSQLIPYDEIRWMRHEELNKLDVTEFKSGDYSIILEVDLDVPKEVHDSTNVYPLAPGHVKVSEDLISGYSSLLLKDYKLKHNSMLKLAPNLYNKERYIVHIDNLQFYLKHGLILKKIHRGIIFRQQAWLKPYVEFNSERRRNATNDFEKSFYKLMVNAIYGKLMENVRKYKDVKLISTERQHTMYTNKPQFKRFSILDDWLVAVELVKNKVVLNKAIYAGFCVLDLSKLRMYQLHYDAIKTTFGDRAILCYTDTDSMTYMIKTKNLFQDLQPIRQWFDFSNYPKDHFMYGTENMGIPGFFKDEAEGKQILEFVGLRSKCYQL